jgi:hypothetical protein
MTQEDIEKNFNRGGYLHHFKETKLFSEFMGFYKDLRGSVTDYQFKKLNFSWDAIPPGWDSSQEDEVRGPFGYYGCSSNELSLNNALLRITGEATPKSLVIRQPGKNGNYGGLRYAFEISFNYQKRKRFGVYITKVGWTRRNVKSIMKKRNQFICTKQIMANSRKGTKMWN